MSHYKERKYTYALCLEKLHYEKKSRLEKRKGKLHCKPHRSTMDLRRWGVHNHQMNCYENENSYSQKHNGCQTQRASIVLFLAVSQVISTVLLNLIPEEAKLLSMQGKAKIVGKVIICFKVFLRVLVYRVYKDFSFNLITMNNFEQIKLTISKEN